MNYIKGSRSASMMPFLSIIVVLILFSSLIHVDNVKGAVSPLKRGRGDAAGAAAHDDTDNNNHAESAGQQQDPVPKVVRLPRVLDFKEYAMKFNKAYESTELMAKANLFLARVINIFRHNAKFLEQQYGYFLGLNEFTDISAKDFETMGSNGDPALQAVQETEHYPANMPASELPSVQQLTGSEGFSMLAADDDELSMAPYEALYGDKRAQASKQALVDFSNENESGNISDFYREFMKSVAPEDAERVSKVIDLNRKLGDDDDEGAKIERNSLSKSDPKSERAMIRRKIAYKPVVESDNANYDEMHMVSHGVYDNMQAGRSFSDKMAAFLVYDMDIMEDLRPYEPPSKKVRTKTEGADDDDAQSSYFKSFFSTAKDVAKSMATSLLKDTLFELDEEDFADFDDEKTEEIDQKSREQNEANSKRIKYTVDWRVTGCITKPKSQGSCNACVAFTVVALMEYYHCRQTHDLTEFSTQYIVDCGKRTKLQGCKGAYLGKVGEFVSRYGLELQAMYPYSGVDGQCPYGPGDEKKMGYLRPKILNWMYVKKMSDWYEHVRKGPLLVGIAMPSDFLAYAGGIHDGIDCNTDKVHAMLLIGSGSQGGKEFWLFKNSFSSDWGENGYFRLAKDAPLKCFNSGVVVRANFVEGGTKNREHKKPVIANVQTKYPSTS